MACGQGHQFSFQVQVHQIIKVQAAIGQFQIRKHRVVALEVAVRGYMKEARSRSKLQNSVSCRLAPEKGDSFREDSAESADLFTEPRSHPVGQADCDKATTAMPSRCSRTPLSSSALAPGSTEPQNGCARGVRNLKPVNQAVVTRTERVERYVVKRTVRYNDEMVLLEQPLQRRKEFAIKTA